MFLAVFATLPDRCVALVCVRRATKLASSQAGAGTRPGMGRRRCQPVGEGDRHLPTRHDTVHCARLGRTGGCRAGPDIVGGEEGNVQGPLRWRPAQTPPCFSHGIVPEARLKMYCHSFVSFLALSSNHDVALRHIIAPYVRSIHLPPQLLTRSDTTLLKGVQGWGNTLRDITVTVRGVHI